MADHQDYFNYLQGRGRLGLVYRQHYLYPRLNAQLAGLTLDVGCGIGDMVRFRSNTEGVDINPETVRWCREQGLPVQLMEQDRLPFSDESFDSILMDNVLEHILQPSPLLREAHRVLRPEGRLVVGVPGKKGFAADPDHKVFYDAPMLTSLVQSSGFTCIRLFATPWRSGWLDRHLKQYCNYGTFAKV